MKNPREVLKELSGKAKVIRDANQLPTINQALLEGIYTDDVHTVFKSYKGWMDLGFQVKRGAKAFMIWGVPEEVDGEEEVYTRFPVRFVFSNAQVFKKGRRLKAEETPAYRRAEA